MTGIRAALISSSTEAGRRPVIVDAAHARSVARAFVARLRTGAAKVDAERRIPDEIIADLSEAGLFRISAPRVFGGSQLGIAPLIEAIAAVASGCGSTGWVYAVLSGHNWAVGLFPEEAQREVFCDPDALVASIVRLGGNPPQKVAGGYLLEGAVGKFCSGIEHAKWVMLGTGVRNGSGPPEPRYLLVPKSDIEVIDDWHTAGLRGTRSNSLKIRKAFVPEHRSISISDAAFGIAPGIVLHDSSVYRAPFPQILPYPLAAVPIGIAQSALDIFVENYRGKLQGYVEGQAAEQSAVLARLSGAHAEIAAATALLRSDALEMDAIEDGSKTPELDRARFVRDAAWAANTCRYAVTSLFEASGGSSIYDGVAIQRIWRDISAAAGHNAFMRDKLDPAFGRALTGLPPSKFDRIGH